jgi:D-alanine-D-alanine ligase-like ATP-grasp enzyme
VKSKIIDTVRKTVITLEPYLLHYYHAKVENDHQNAKNFHILGVDILLDKKLNAWLMEINANPSLCMFIEKILYLGNPIPKRS